jgi:hypothetical protein
VAARLLGLRASPARSWSKGQHLRPLAIMVAFALLLAGTATAQCPLGPVIITLDEALYGCTNCQGDRDDDGQVTVADVILASNESCTSPTATPTQTRDPTATPTSPTSTRTPTPRQTPALTGTVAGCPLDFDDNNQDAAKCAYVGTGSNTCVGDGPMVALWQSDGSSMVAAIFSGASGDTIAVATRTSASTASVQAIAAGPDFTDFVSASGSLTLLSASHFDGNFTSDTSCADLIFSGTFDTLVPPTSSQLAPNPTLGMSLKRLHERAIASTRFRMPSPSQ